MSVPEIDTPSLKKRLDLRANGDDKFYLLDVRNPHEQDIALIPGTDLLIPVTELESRIDELEAWKKEGTEVLVYCRSGGRSGNAVRILMENGILNCKNVAGGTLAYSDLVDPNMEKY
ncbi:rhodanese-like domain-containing protein [Leptospira sp. GIMC2001]|uniref:rhodanese-like domain-containing protein n=1 Tax=Leptospira sp. GIMC2001 TaxID=1513297 RepID=UPI00234960AD|nr:rhodanese-like domain-containing protein [Leptospira sp. GIMC2001]WCL49879.1 rhodanese-like domain-containing protein [Leptospira sp. GIMC2001]